MPCSPQDTTWRLPYIQVRLPLSSTNKQSFLSFFSLVSHCASDDRELLSRFFCHHQFSLPTKWRLLDARGNFQKWTGGAKGTMSPIWKSLRTLLFSTSSFGCQSFRTKTEALSLIPFSRSRVFEGGQSASPALSRSHVWEEHFQFKKTLVDPMATRERQLLTSSPDHCCKNITGVLL